MWEDTEHGAITAAAADTAAAAHLSSLSIERKSCAGLCFTAAAVWEFLDEALNIPETVDITDAMQSARTRKHRE